VEVFHRLLLRNLLVCIGIVVEIMQVVYHITGYFKCSTISGVDCNLPTSA